MGDAPVPLTIVGEIDIMPALTPAEWRDTPYDPAHPKGWLRLAVRETPTTNGNGRQVEEWSIAVGWSGAHAPAGRGSTSNEVHQALLQLMQRWPDRTYSGHLQVQRGTDRWRIAPVLDEQHPAGPWLCEIVRPVELWRHDYGQQAEVGELLRRLGVGRGAGDVGAAEQEALRAADWLLEQLGHRAGPTWTSSGGLAHYTPAAVQG
jgi:hypothetical protein